MLHPRSASRSPTAYVIACALFLGTALATAPASAHPNDRRYAPDADGIFWFMHISDTHVDSFVPSSEAQLRLMLGNIMDVIDPIFVFSTGDLTDGSPTVLGRQIPTGGQQESEWQLYKTIWGDMGMKPNFFFDTPGNHDNYGDQNLKNFLEYSLQGSFTKTNLFADTSHATALGRYYFIATNSAGLYGSPITFGNPQFTHVPDIQAGIEANADAQLVFVFAHHHIVDHGDTGLQNALNIGGTDDPPGNASVVLPLLESVGAFYLHGHVHQYKECLQGDLVTVQIAATKSVSPSVDRSAANWPKTKYRSNVGIGIIDHNAFVYGITDTGNPWPFVAITAPVDMYLKGGGTPPGVGYVGDYLDYGIQPNPYAYDVCLDREDNPVRAVVLSNEDVSSVRVSIDSSEVGSLEAVERLDEQHGVYATTINTKGLEPGRHTLSVTAVAGGKSRTDSIQLRFTQGPCEPLVPSPPDAGADATDDTEEPAEAGAPETSNPDPQDGGDVDTGLDPISDDDVNDAGCACYIGPSGSSGSFAGIAALLFGLGALMSRRKHV